MAHAEVSVDLPVGADEAWDAVVNWERQSAWMLLTDVAGGSGLGARVSARTAVGPVGFTDDMEIIVWDPPRLCRVRHLGKVVRGEGGFAVADLGPGRSRFTWTEDVPTPLVRPALEFFMRLSLRRLAKQVAA